MRRGMSKGLQPYWSWTRESLETPVLSFYFKNVSIENWLYFIMNRKRKKLFN